MRQLRHVKVLVRRDDPPSELIRYIRDKRAGAQAGAGPVGGLGLFGIQVFQGPEPFPLARFLSSLNELADLVSSLLQAEIDRRIDGRFTISFTREGEGLVPFTDLCSPSPVRARQCTCGSWVRVGDTSCEYCRDPAPLGPPTLFWTPANPFFVPLVPTHLNVAARPNAAVGLDDGDVDWGNDDD
jgi:hypothetical protein